MKKIYKYKLGVIGCGFMAKAILDGAISSDAIRAKKVIVSDVNEKNLVTASEELGVFVTKDNKYVAENSEFLLFAVKPQNFDEVAKVIKEVSPEKVISIMAGVKKAYIKNNISFGVCKVARCMPNLPLSVGAGMVGIDMSDFDGEPNDAEFVTKLFDSAGRVLSVNESKMDAVTGISGSGPAYVFMFIDSLVDAGVKQGLTRNEAKTLAIQTVFGGAEMVLQSEKPISELIMNVCSKGGTTIEAIKVFEENNFRGIVSDAVDACVKRSKELSER